MTKTHILTSEEKITSIVYGDTFSLYDDQSFDEFVEPLRRRLDINNITPKTFKGKKCLDAGCGGGRGSFLMGEFGAREVIGVDLSQTNIDSCRRRAEQKKVHKINFLQSSLVKLPFSDETFDIIWCNGVLHHAVDPDRSLREISRVLKKNGFLWLYVYGSGGIYWFVIDWIREFIKEIDPRKCISQLLLMNIPTRRIAEWIDDWFTPYLRRYTAVDVEKRLKELGFSKTLPLKGGVEYDTSQRRIGASRLEKSLMGEGDLRFFAQKKGMAVAHRHFLPDPPDRRGSCYKNPTIVTQFGRVLQKINAELVHETINPKYSELIKIMIAGLIQSQVRTALETPRALDPQQLKKDFTGIHSLLRKFLG